MLPRTWVALGVVVGLCGACSPASASSTAVASPITGTSATASATTTPTPLSVDRYAPPGWVSLSNVEPTILLDIRYFTAHNFVGRRVDGYLEGECLLPRTTAIELQKVQRRALAEGYALKVYDCYRPLRAGKDFRRWASDPTDQTTKQEFYPQIDKSQLFDLGYLAAGSSKHSSGSTIDLTLVALPAVDQRSYVPGEPLVNCTAPPDQRFPDNSIDMGTGYDCFDPRSHTLDERITGTPRENRLRLKRLMATGGFVNYRNEWWHYDLTDPPYPGQYFDFPVARAALI